MKIVIIVTLVTLIINSWWAYCINKTFTTLRNMSNHLFEKEDWAELLDLKHEVKFDQVLWAMFFFKDWRNLYSEKLRNRIPEAFK